MSKYKRYADKTNCMYFMIKDENLFDNYMTIWEKVINVIKQKFNSELIYNRQFLKAGKRFNTKERFQCFYIPVILFDSFYRKDGKYYRKVFLEKIILNFFRRSIINFGFRVLKVPPEI